MLEVRPDWSPNGVERFKQLVEPLCQHWKYGQVENIENMCVLCVCVFLYWACITRLLSSTYFVIHLLVMHEVFESVKGRTIMGRALKMLHLV